jgi:hypothetical protein
MNGRVYDYNVGRFMGVDPFIQGVGNSQGINPYSYVMNNPLAFTDPSGYCATETGTRLRKCVDVEVTDVDTGETSTKSLNAMHSNFAGNVEQHISNTLGNGARINGVSATFEGGKTIDLMSQSETAKGDRAADKLTTVGGPVSSMNVSGIAGEIDTTYAENTLLSVGVGLTPAGIIADGYTFGTGEDYFTGEEVSGVWRWAAIIPLVTELKPLKSMRRAGEFSLLNKAGKFYPKVSDLRTGKPIAFPTSDLKRTSQSKRVQWGAKERGDFIKQWYDLGYKTPRGGWSNYDIHHIKPREFGGSNQFWNLTPVQRNTHQKEFNTFWRDM